jgi:hypothetical protein
LRAGRNVWRHHTQLASRCAVPDRRRARATCGRAS